MSKMNLMKQSGVALVIAASASWAQAGATAYLTIPYAELAALNTDWSKPHEARPLNVPAGYDWAKSPAMNLGNKVPANFVSMTGWGQVFWSTTATPTTNVVQFRDFITLMCYGPDRKWILLQRGPIDGAQFLATFENNTAKAAQTFAVTSEQATAQFSQGAAFHFWPAMGRANMPDVNNNCGFVILMQARVTVPPVRSTTTAAALADAKAADAILPNTYLVGLGADYWLSKTAVWDNYKTNKAVGVGRLRYATKNWGWFGMSTASDADLLRLYQTGYDMGTFK